MDKDTAYCYYLDMMHRNNSKENLGLTDSEINSQWDWYYNQWCKNGIIIKSKK